MGRIILPETIFLAKGDSIASGNCIPVHMGMAGKYRAQITKGRTGKLKYDTGWFDNLITNRGLVEYWNLPHYGAFDSGAIGASCAVGTGNTTPQVTDVGLASFTAAAGGTGGTGGGTGYPAPNAQGYVAQVSVPGQPDYVPPYWYMRYIYLFATGAAAGNLTEVGAYPGGGSPNADLFSRALILDASGNPTSITVLSDEILTVTWELRFYLDVTDHAFSFNLNGSPITGTYRLWNASSQSANPAAINTSGAGCTLYSGAMAASPLTGSPTGTIGNLASNSGAMSFVQFVNDIANSGTCYFDIKGTFPTGNGTGTIQSFSYNQHMWAYQFGALSSPIIKTAGQQLQVNFRASWGRYP
jgi:hypothetical protein